MMRWIIEESVFSEESYKKIISCLNKNNIDYSLIRVEPFTYNIDGKIPDNNGNCILYGSLGIQNVAKKYNYFPGVYTSEDIDESNLIKVFEEEYLNNDAKIYFLNEVTENDLDEEFFIKPNKDSKEFAGQILTRDNFSKWLSNLLNIGYLSDINFEVLVSSPKKIISEWRTIVYEKEIITGSLYRKYGKLYLKEDLPLDLKRYGENLINKKNFNPTKIYALDFALTNDGYKVIEINTFNSASLYECDLNKIISILK